jgi:hypothetical protein
LPFPYSNSNFVIAKNPSRTGLQITAESQLYVGARNVLRTFSGKGEFDLVSNLPWPASPEIFELTYGATIRIVSQGTYNSPAAASETHEPFVSTGLMEPETPDTPAAASDEPPLSDCCLNRDPRSSTGYTWTLEDGRVVPAAVSKIIKPGEPDSG